MIDIVFGDIFEQDVDVIVNPANSYMLHGGGLARAIAFQGGARVVKESQEQTPVATGEAIITSPGQLPFQAIIHAVGPVWEGEEDYPYWRKNSSDEDPDDLLAQAYRSSIMLAGIHKYESIAFPAISCGVFRFPVERAAPIAIRAIRESLASDDIVKKVLICVLDDAHYAAFCEANEKSTLDLTPDDGTRAAQE